MKTTEFKKGSNENASTHFLSKEFDCPCTSCDKTLVHPELLVFLEAIRAVVGPIKITSGYRCQAYQDDLRKRGYETAKGISSHTLGEAVDLLTNKHFGIELEKVARTVGVKAVGVAKKWIHIDLRKDAVRRWTYS
jgi:uncharacterized protein YcbK (DUF882 family)